MKIHIKVTTINIQNMFSCLSQSDFLAFFLNYYILHKSKSRINQRLVGTKGCLTSVGLFSGAWAHSMLMVSTVV